MGLRMVTNPGMLEIRVEQIGQRAVKNMSRRMHRHAIMIRDLMREFAPRKSGLLESAIDYDIQRSSLRRNTYVVFINLDATKTTASGGTVELGEYAFLMNERLRPHGRGGPAVQLGKISAQKAAGGKKVGGRFLSRAITDATKTVFADMIDEVRRVTSVGAGSVGMQFQRG